MGLNPCFWKTYHHILMHFVHQFQCFEMFLKFFQKLCFSLKFLWTFVWFDWSNLFFDQSKLFWNCFKIFNESLSVSINRNLWIKFLKNQIWLVQTTFSKLFLSLRLGKAPQRFFFFVFLQISCKVSLSISRYVYITLLFALFFMISCIFFMVLGKFSDYA